MVLTLAGRLDLAAAPQLQQPVLKQLDQHPPAIVCDLAQVEAIDPLRAGVFPSVPHLALGWTTTTLVLCASRPQVADSLLRQRAARYLVMYPSLDEALAKVRAGGVSPLALEGLAESADLVASELATTCGPAGTVLKLRRSRLQVAVQDQDRTCWGCWRPKRGPTTG
jgi:anti-anti-sigma regulatory factor